MKSEEFTMRRRTDTQLSPHQLFDETLNSPLYWSGKTVCLERNSLSDYRQRSMSGHISIAELYHENSKLFWQMLPELAASFTQSADCRREFIQRRMVVTQARNSQGITIDQPCHDLLIKVGHISDVNLFYAVELRLLVGSVLSSYEPISQTLQSIKLLSPKDLDTLTQALRLTRHSTITLDNRPLLLLIGSFARNEVLLGQRGYRRTLLEAGQIAQEIVLQAEQLDLEVQPVYEFIDRDVDAIMEVDGTEQGTLIIFLLGGTPDVSS